MNPRFDYQKAAQEPLHAMFSLEKYLRGCGLEASLLELVKFRASQQGSQGGILPLTRPLLLSSFR